MQKVKKKLFSGIRETNTDIPAARKTRTLLSKIFQ